MLERFQFYIQHSFADLKSNRLRTLFAVFCIATGVGAVIALQNLGVMINDTLTSDLQKQNRGDITITIQDDSVDEYEPDELTFTDEGVEGDFDPIVQKGLDEGGLTFYEFGGGVIYLTALSPDLTSVLETWADGNGYGEFESIGSVNGGLNFGEVFLGLAPGSIVFHPAEESQVGQQSAIFVDPARYPFYDEIITQEGDNLQDVLTQPDQVVLSQITADKLDAEVGDTLELNLLDGEFRVVGIVDTNTEIRNPFSEDMFIGIFGYYYLSQDVLQISDTANKDVVGKLYLKLDDPSVTNEMAAQLEKDFPYLQTAIPDDILEVNREIATTIDDILKAIGLLALLLGSIGIINTMQVIVSRRTLEIGVLKTIGMKGRQITTLFIVEAILLGIIASIVGLIGGTLLTFGVRIFGENLLNQDLAFKVATEPMINGLLIGIVITIVFGFLPTLTAAKVRPAIVLRPKDAALPRSGILAIFLTLGLTVLVLAFTVKNIMGFSFLMSAAIVGVVFLIGAGLFPVLWVLIWLVARLFPQLRRAELELAKTQLRTTKSRSAVTLMALVIGIFSLSTITLFADSFSSLIDELLVNVADGRPVLVQSLEPGNEDGIETVLQNSSHVDDYAMIASYDTRLVQIEHASGEIVLGSDLEVLADAEAKRRESNNENRSFDDDGSSVEFQNASEAYFITSVFDEMTAVQLKATGYSSEDITRGRGLNNGDVSTPGIVLRDPQWLPNLSLQVGDQVTLAFGSERDDNLTEIVFTIVGFADQNEEALNGAGSDASYMLRDIVPETVKPLEVQFNVAINEENVGKLQREIHQVDENTLVFDLRIISTVVNVIVDKFSSFPTLFGVVGVLVGAVVIANSVALSTLERRKDIAVLKSIGLKRQGILAMIVAENAMLGIVGALFGVGFGVVAIEVYDWYDKEIDMTVNWWIVAAMAGLSLFVAIGSALLASWDTSGEKPLNVLRYE